MAIAVVAAFVMGTLMAGNVAEAGNPLKNLENYVKQLDRTTAKLTGTVEGIGTGPFPDDDSTTALIVELDSIEINAREIQLIASDAREIIIAGTTP